MKKSLHVVLIAFSLIGLVTAVFTGVFFCLIKMVQKAFCDFHIDLSFEDLDENVEPEIVSKA